MYIECHKIFLNVGIDYIRNIMRYVNLCDFYAKMYF